MPDRENIVQFFQIDAIIDPRWNTHLSLWLFIMASATTAWPLQHTVK